MPPKVCVCRGIVSRQSALSSLSSPDCLVTKLQSTVWLVTFRPILLWKLFTQYYPTVCPSFGITVTVKDSSAALFCIWYRWNIWIAWFYQTIFCIPHDALGARRQLGTAKVLSPVVRQRCRCDIVCVWWGLNIMIPESLPSSSAPLSGLDSSFCRLLGPFDSSSSIALNISISHWSAATGTLFQHKLFQYKVINIYPLYQLLEYVYIPYVHKYHHYSKKAKFCTKVENFEVNVT